jgi:DNA polymerase III gamma/tau subunit
METALLGQSDAVNTINKVITDPPHIFLSGGYGSGKTSFVHEILKYYYSSHKISYMDPAWTLWLSSEQDRGIHCVRQSVTEFVRHTSAIEGVYRWIIIDDADSFPTISQQALRRPMETHAHTTRFIFVSRHVSDIIQPIRSRCLHIELDTIPPMILMSHFFKQNGFPNVALDPSAIGAIFSLAQTPTHLRNMSKVICSIYGNSGKPVEGHDIIGLFAAPAFSLCVKLLNAYIDKNRDDMHNIFMSIWTTGISYEDFLHELTQSVRQLGHIDPVVNQDIHQMILKGWILFAQGKTHVLDLIRLFMV